MTPTVTVTEIELFDRAGLLALWPTLMGGLPPKGLSQPFFRRFLAFELQARQYGGLPKGFAAQLAKVGTGAARPKTPGLRSGGRLLREWNGVSHVVDVMAVGYLWRGEKHRSLSAIARAITGAQWSGPRFFGLVEPKARVGA